jgi:TonB family protein
MKTCKLFPTAILMIAMMIINVSCDQEKVDPALVLDEVFIPEGYNQADNPPDNALARLEELRLQNPNDHFYYLKRIDTTSDKWIFPQKELKIEMVEYGDQQVISSHSIPQGVVVKKIRGDYRDEEFIILENQPSPREGLKAFYHYIQENLKYPEEAKKMGIEGKVFVQFIVDNNGKLTEVKAVKGIGAGCDEEAVRVIKEAHAWNPATVVDVPVKTRMILPITYKLN